MLTFSISHVRSIHFCNHCLPIPSTFQKWWWVMAFQLISKLPTSTNTQRASEFPQGPQFSHFLLPQSDHQPTFNFSGDPTNRTSPDQPCFPLSLVPLQWHKPPSIRECDKWVMGPKSLLLIWIDIPPKFSSSPLKNGGWKEDKPFLSGFSSFSGENSLLNFGRVTKISISKACKVKVCFGMFCTGDPSLVCAQVLTYLGFVFGTDSMPDSTHMSPWGWWIKLKVCPPCIHIYQHICYINKSSV